MHAPDRRQAQRNLSSTALAAESRDSHLTLRRVERQQRLVELLGAVREPVPSAVLARRLGVGLRTAERDLARLRESGVPIESMPGTFGGHRLPRTAAPNPLSLTFEEVAALIASLAALGPTSTHSADSAMRALVQAIAPDVAEAGEDQQPHRHVSRPRTNQILAHKIIAPSRASAPHPWGEESRRDRDARPADQGCATGSAARSSRALAQTP
jgi:biotin operon repressor